MTAHPFIASALAAITVDAASQRTAQFASALLVNDTDADIEIDSIRFMVFPTTFNLAGAGTYDLCSIIAASVEIDRRPLTSGYVYLRGLGSRKQVALEIGQNAIGRDFPVSYVDWPFPPGCILRQGAAPDIRIRADALSDAPATTGYGGLNVWATVVGRGGPLRTGRPCVPYVTEFAPGAMQYTGGVNFAASIRPSLTNLLGVPLHLERLRVWMATAVVAADTAVPASLNRDPASLLASVVGPSNSDIVKGHVP
ncbi:MAG TPA: hypothetical protein VMW52_07285, partial [Phycisphaerae bacterium]|nr:hypothetical protein [Phycisphaerae bacterium]